MQKTLSIFILAVISFTACSTRFHGTSDAKPEIQTGNSNWGKPVEGVSVRLLPIKSHWTNRENLELTVDIKNTGPGFTLGDLDGWLLEWDGDSFLLRHDSHEWTVSQQLAQNETITNFAKLQFKQNREQLDQQIELWVFLHSGSQGIYGIEETTLKSVPYKLIQLTSGRHSVRIGFPLRSRTDGGGTDEQPKWAFSNPVEIDIGN